MKHLGERIVDFVFKELSPAEMLEAQRHVAECTVCRQEVEQFQNTSSILRAAGSVEPPRRLIFEAEKPKRTWISRWAAPLSAAAAILLVVFWAIPVQVQRDGSRLTIAFGAAPIQPVPVSVSAPPVAQLPAQPTVQPVDYDRIVREVQENQQAWLAGELSQRDVAHAREIQRLRGELVYIDSVQRSMLRETMQNASSIQLLAQRNE